MDSKDHIGLDEIGRWWDIGILTPYPGVGDVYDLVHANALEQNGDGLLLSLRHTDAIYRFDRATGAIEWKLGGTATPQRLTPDPLDPAAAARGACPAATGSSRGAGRARSPS